MSARGAGVSRHAQTTTRYFDKALPDLEQLKAGGLLERGQGDRGLDGALGMVGLEDEIAIFENADD
jgi:hypothetical protein